jgi:acetate kinase
MSDGQQLRILTINSGSSSLKFSLYAVGASEELQLSGGLDQLGSEGSAFRARDRAGEVLIDETRDLPDHRAALGALFDWLRQQGHEQGIDAVGHRLVHGGAEFSRAHLVTGDLMQRVRELRPFAPDHLPHEIAAIEAVAERWPELRQVACFDTAFHRSMPKRARVYPLPRRLRREGVLRYGFHGLSYEYIVGELRRRAGAEADGRLIIAHLGNGASMAAIRGGRSIETTMGFTPAGGLVMSTRSGDLDPGVIVYLLREKGLGAEEVNDLVNHDAGLLGVSGRSQYMKELLEAEGSDPRAAEAVDLFCYQARKHLGALAAVLGGLETLVFTGGMGENAPAIRERICAGMEFLGIRLDAARNAAGEGVISPEGAPVRVRMMETNEGLMIARHVGRLLRGASDEDAGA